MSNAAPHSHLEDHPSTIKRRVDFGARPRKLLTKRSFKTSISDNNENESLSSSSGGAVWAKGRKCMKRSEGSTANRICKSLQTHSSSPPLSTANNNLSRRSEHYDFQLNHDSDHDFDGCSSSSTKGHPIRPNFFLHRSSSTPLLSLSTASLQTLNERVATQETMFLNSFLTLQPMSLERSNKPTLFPSDRSPRVEKDTVPTAPGTANSTASFFSTSTESSTVLTPSDYLFSFQQTTNLSGACSDIDKSDVMDLDLDLPNLSVSSSSTHSSSWAELEGGTEPTEPDEEDEDDLIVLDESFGLEGCFGKVELMDELSMMMKRAHLPKPSFSDEDLDPGELFD
ncbi:hypothetical protein [Phaffia rhodozyma]|uniref:Uncharacterized protein n=1 Tax=Phaffia rhodozyma TaxID=264483 RepID=A0A0F7SHK4_PHARH|nr:hypothetical protein [Phaffia rhodozyma]